MLKPYSEMFLDGQSMDYVREITGQNFFITQNNYSLSEVINLINLYI